LCEQRLIVAEIEKQFSRLDEAVANLKRVKANLKRYKAAVLKAAVEGKLTEQWRKAHPDVESASELLKRILAERRAKWNGKGKYRDPAPPDKTDPSPRPEGWVWATIEQLAAVEPNSITDGPFGSNLKTSHYTPEGPRVVRLQNIGDGVFIDEQAHISVGHFEQLTKHHVFSGDLVIAALGQNPPRACVIPEFLGPAMVKADCIRFKPNSRLSPKYLNYVLNAQPTRVRTKVIVHGIGRPRLTLAEIKSIILPVSPASEQQRIVDEVERRLSVIDGLEAQVAANLQRAERFRQSILQRAFAGKLIDTECPHTSEIGQKSLCGLLATQR
jgi:type I restriction enzyme, S subunit